MLSPFRFFVPDDLRGKNKFRHDSEHDQKTDMRDSKLTEENFNFSDSNWTTDSEEESENRTISKRRSATRCKKLHGKLRKRGISLVKTSHINRRMQIANFCAPQHPTECEKSIQRDQIAHVEQTPNILVDQISKIETKTNSNKGYLNSALTGIRVA